MRVKSKRQVSWLPNGPVDHALAHFVSIHKNHLPWLTSKTSKIGIAYSGGADSTALLLSALRMWPDQVYALHVHHGLQSAADAFMVHCQQQCEQWRIPFFAQCIDARHQVGESPEDAARKGRYQTLIHLAKTQSLDSVLLGQHADDQVETLILALSRGAGLSGLSSMPAVFYKDELTFARPMLDVSVKALKTYLQEQEVSWVEDPTNQQKVYTRNKIRLDILPAIASTFPHYKDTFARSIHHIVQAQQLLDELAQQDLEKVGVPPLISQLRSLSEQRQTNALRFWLKKGYGVSPSTKQMCELLKQVQACSTRGHKIHMKVADGTVVRQGELLRFNR